MAPCPAHAEVHLVFPGLCSTADWQLPLELLLATVLYFLATPCLTVSSEADSLSPSTWGTPSN